MQVWVRMFVENPYDESFSWDHTSFYFPHVVDIHQTLRKIFDENYLNVVEYHIIKIKYDKKP